MRPLRMNIVARKLSGLDEKCTESYVWYPPTHNVHCFALLNQKPRGATSYK